MGQAKLRKTQIDKLKISNANYFNKFKYTFIVRFNDKFLYAISDKSLNDVVFNNIPCAQLISTISVSAFKYLEEEHLVRMIDGAKNYILQSTNKEHFSKIHGDFGANNNCIVLYIDFKSLKETKLCIIESTSIATVSDYKAMLRLVSKEFETNSNGVLLEME